MVQGSRTNKKYRTNKSHFRLISDANHVTPEKGGKFFHCVPGSEKVHPHGDIWSRFCLELSTVTIVGLTLYEKGEFCPTFRRFNVEQPRWAIIGHGHLRSVFETVWWGSNYIGRLIGLVCRKSALSSTSLMSACRLRGKSGKECRTAGFAEPVRDTVHERELDVDLEQAIIVCQSDKKTRSIKRTRLR